MKILAIDTSSKNATVAILEDMQVLVELNNADEKTHSQKLMPMIDEAFKKVGLSLDDISMLSCCLGPGSFTGVRIGIATSKAFCDSKHMAVTGVSSLEGLAYNLNKEGYVCSLIDAKNGNLYAGLFHLQKKNGLLQTTESNLQFIDLKDDTGKIISDKLVDFLENNCNICLHTSTIYFVGDGAIFYKNLLQNLNLKNEIKICISSQNSCISSSISIAKCGYTKYKNGEYGDSSILSPIYLRKSQAELALEKKLNS